MKTIAKKKVTGEEVVILTNESIADRVIDSNGYLYDVSFRYKSTAACVAKLFGINVYYIPVKDQEGKLVRIRLFDKDLFEESDTFNQYILKSAKMNKYCF